MAHRKSDKSRRSEAQKAGVMVRISELAHQKLQRIAQDERRSMGQQAGLFIEKALKAIR